MTPRATVPTVSACTHAAFLRAINVGGHVVTMEKLRAVLSSRALGLSNVATFIASGNVLFSTSAADESALERQIEARLKRQLGYEVATFVRSVGEIAAMAAREPFPPVEGKATLFVALLRQRPSADASRKLMALQTEVDQFQLHGRELYWRIRGGYSDSAVSGALVEKTLGMPATVRNISTLKRLAAKYPVNG
jgi:uncharacterized protein (DUF1697 family)